jgi:hypothetical protein
VQRDAEPAGGAPAGLVGVVIGKANLRIDDLARQELHDALLEHRQGLAFAQHQRMALRLRLRVGLQRGHVHPHQLAGGRLRAVDRKPGGLLLAQALQLLVHRLLGDVRDLAGQCEAAEGGELQVGPNLDQELELDGAAVLDLEVAHRGIRDRLERLGFLGLVPALADDVLDDGLADGFLIALAHEGGRGVAGAKPWQPDPAGDLGDGPVLGRTDPVGGDGHLE